MSPTIRAVVCGSSVYMAALAASLQANADVAVQRVPANPAALRQCLDASVPALMAFDLDEMSGDLAIALLRDHPELILVGVDPSSDRMLVVSGRQEQPSSAAELLRAIAGSRVGGSQFSVISDPKDFF